MPAVALNSITTCTSRILSMLTISGYAGDERSVDNGEPEELYLFNLEDREYWAYTSCDYAIPYDGNTYVPELIKRTDIQLNSNSLNNKINIETDISNLFARNYITEGLEGEVKVTIYRRHRNSADYKTYWKGYVQGVGFKGDTATIIAGLKDKSLSRCGLMRKFQRTCGLILYSKWCTISEDDSDFYVTGTILTVDNITITAAEFDTLPSATLEDGWLKNGKFKSDDSSCLQRIVYHVGDTIKIARPIAALKVGDTFKANAGCDYLHATCKDKFSNKLNFGGQPNLPSKNPMDGGSIVYK